MLLNVYPLLPRFFQLIKHALGTFNLRRFSLQLDPSFAGGDLYSERIFQRFQELEIVSIERLQSACALKLQGARFRHYESAMGDFQIDSAVENTEILRERGRRSLVCETINT